MRSRRERRRAVRSLGAVEAISLAQGIRPRSADRLEYEPEVAGVRGALSREALAAARAQGRAMTLEQAISHALS